MKCPACPGRSGAIAGRVQQSRGRLASGRLPLPSRDVRQSPPCGTRSFVIMRIRTFVRIMCLLAEWGDVLGFSGNLALMLAQPPAWLW